MLCGFESHHRLSRSLASSPGAIRLSAELAAAAVLAIHPVVAVRDGHEFGTCLEQVALVAKNLTQC